MQPQNIEELAEEFDAQAEEMFWDGATVDDISAALFLAWLNAKDTQYDEQEIVDALRLAADVITQGTAH